MCGIAGAVALDRAREIDPDRVRRMTSLVAHRGPDAEGFWTSETYRAAFGHRRLSVIDLTTGQQPILSEDGSLSLTFNGEIYNYKELRAELAADGARFWTESDTEVLLRMYERHGDACLDQLRGMFAFALWDETRHRLLIARDRIGKKPLYYTIRDGCLYFASSLAALRESSPVRWEVDVESVDAYLSLAYIPAPRTIYCGVSKLEAGTAMVVENGRVRTFRYWEPQQERASFDGSFEQAVDRFEELLATSVAIRLRSDVPLGVFLSGGLDSSLIAAIAAKHSATAVHTFSIGFDEGPFDESGHAAEVARRLGTEHRTFRGHPQLLALLPALVRHYGEPFGDSSSLPTWLLSEQARKFVTVAVGGDGGDECFAGYNWYRNAARLARLNAFVPRRLAHVGSRMFGFHGAPAIAKARRSFTALSLGEADRFAALRSFMGPAETRSLYTGQLLAARRDTQADPNTWLAGLYSAAGGSSLQRARAVDFSTYLADCLMPKVDVASMAHGLEVRAPLLDHEIVQFAVSLPDAYLTDGVTGKRLLKALLYRYLPKALFQRPKQGFSIPIKLWFAGQLRGTVDELARSERLLSTGWLRADGIRSLVREHAQGHRDHSQRLYSLLVLDEWLKQS